MTSTTGTLTVTRADPRTLARHDVGELSFDGETYEFRYLTAAAAHPGFRPLLGFPDLYTTYTSPTLFPLFAQRVLSPTRSDYSAYMRSLWLDEGSTAWQQLAVSGGQRSSDTIMVRMS